MDKESKNDKEEDRYRERLKMIDREMEEINTIEDNNVFDRLITKNLNELEVVKAELILAKNLMKVEMKIMVVEGEIEKVENKFYDDIDYEEEEGARKYLEGQKSELLEMKLEMKKNA